MDGAGSSNPDWQLSCSKTKERLGHLLKSKLWADCKFLVGEDETEEIYAHKFVLAMSSPVFDTMFNGSMPEGKGAIRVPDVPPKAFKTLLEFLYTDENKVASYQEASEVYCAARKYMVPFIQTQCVSYLEWKLTPSNACFAHEFATLFEEKSLLKAALKTFKRKTKEVLKEGSFYETHINTVTALFSQNELDIDTELDLFNALEKYTSETMGLRNLKRSYSRDHNEETQESPSKKARIEDKIDNVSKDLNLEKRADEQTEDEKRLLAEVRQAVPHIRFLTLSARQLAGAAPSVLLTDDEAYALMMNVVGVPVTLPDTLCPIRMPRGVREWSPDYTEGGGPSTSTSQKAPGQSPTTPPKTSVFEVMCTFNVQNFKTRKRNVKSNAFFTDYLEWQINLVPGMEKLPDGQEQKTAGVHVECSSKKSVWSCSARVTIELVAEGKESLRRVFTKTYSDKSTTHGYRHLVPWTVLCNNYLVTNTLRIDVRVHATVPLAS